MYIRILKICCTRVTNYAGLDLFPLFLGGGSGVRGPEPDMDFKPCKTGCEATKAGVVNYIIIQVHKLMCEVQTAFIAYCIDI